MLKLIDVLEKMDRLGALNDLTNKYNHKICYNNSRTIIKYVGKDVLLTAYAYNPGNAVVIFEKQNGLIAYGCYFDGFPDNENYSSFHWNILDLNVALDLIKKDIWEKSEYKVDVDYKDTSFKSRWEKVASGKLEYTSSHKDSVETVKNFKENYDKFVYTGDFVILRTLSKKLRIEVDEAYQPFEEFTEIILFFQNHKDDDSISILQLPELNSWRKVLSISHIDKDILNELKVQIISRKIKEAA